MSIFETGAYGREDGQLRSVIKFYGILKDAFEKASLSWGWGEKPRNKQTKPILNHIIKKIINSIAKINLHMIRRIDIMCLQYKLMIYRHYA